MKIGKPTDEKHVWLEQTKEGSVDIMAGKHLTGPEDAAAKRLATITMDDMIVIFSGTGNRIAVVNHNGKKEYDNYD